MNWPAAFYCTVVDCFIWGGTGYAVFFLDHSGWWLLGALFVSACVGVPDGVRRPLNRTES